MRKMYAYLGAGCLLFLTISTWAQSTVSGRVQDENGEALIGVSVLEKGTTNGTITDIEGQFQVRLTQEDPTMIFSSIGYITSEVPLNNRSQLEVIMREDIAQLQEIVVVGYGTQKRVNLSGAVDQIDAEVLESRPISNTAQGLQGVIPNLNIDFLSGEPGAAANINIRGLTSINGGNPLILIDGVPSEPAELNRVAPQDISDISVIKDASAAAIYGARAAFGVILITTKSGTEEGVNFSYSNNFSWNTPTVLPRKVTDPYIYLRVRETSTDNTPWDNQNYSDQMYQFARERSNDPSISAARINPTDDSQWEYMGDQNWIDHFLSEYTVSQDHALSINGSTDKVGYFISGAYNRQNGVLNVAEDYFDRFSFRSKVDYRPTDWLTIGNNTFLTNTLRENPSALAPLIDVAGRDYTRSSMTTIYDLHPTDWNVNPDGTWANTDAGRLEARLRDGGRTTDKYNSLQSRFTAQASLWQDLFRLNTDFTYRRGATNFNYHTTRYNIGYGPGDVREEGSNYAYRSTTFDDYTVFNIYGTLNKQIGRHQLTAIAGFNQEYFRSEWFSAARTNVISSSLPTIGLATGETAVDEDIFDWAIRGYFYRLNYIFDDKYIVEFNGRYDGTSRFPDGNRYGFFPSASAAWRVDQESFMQPLEDVWSTFKLRASYGSLGNQAVGPFDYIATMSASPSNYLIGGVRPQRVTPPGLVSPNYTWEEVSTLNFGADLGFFGDRLMASFDIYERNTVGMLTLGRELPGVLGEDEPRENAADLQTKGWELSLNYRNDVSLAGSPLTIGTRFVLSDNRVFITGFDNPNRNLTQYYEGMELGEIWGLTSDGLFQSEDEIEALDQSSIIPWGALSIVPGWPRYVDQDSNGAIEKGLTVDDPKDLSVIGNITPRFRFGFDLNMNWRGFDVRAFFQGVAQRDYYPLDYLYWGFYQQPYAGGAPHTLDYYRATSDSDVDRAKHSDAYIAAGLADQNLDAEYPILQSWLADRNLGERIDQSQGLAIPQTRYLLDGSYLRLKNLTVGYTLPSTLVDRLGLSQLRVFFSGENLTEWSALKDFYDPEAINDNLKYDPSVSTGRGEGKGYAYPLQRRYAVGINVNF